MPILAPEPLMFPDGLLDAAVHDPMSDRQWWVMHTLARREKELLRRLRTMAISHYCPLTKRRTRSPAGRVRVSQVPLFTGYVFVWGNEPQRYQALTTNCIARCLAVSDGIRLLADLQQIHRLIESDAPLTPEARIQPGRRVRVRSGAMAGLEGIVIKRRRKEWLVVSVEFLQQGVSVLLEDYQVECI
jgi:transcriptional antiterminator RfaH